MKLTKCDNKHFYDADKYNSCPHCDKRAEPVESEKKAAPDKTDGFVPITRDIKSLPDEIPVAPVEEPPSAAQKAPPDNQEPEIKPSLQDQVNAVAAHISTEDVKTEVHYNFSDSEPVVGWLVCVKGAYAGQSFDLKTGRNNIGRAMNMDIPLAQELSISRNIHAVLTYAPIKRTFYIQAGESSGLTYLNDNDDPVMTFMPIKAYDKIRLGKAEFIFVPFCGENFTWEEYIE